MKFGKDMSGLSECRYSFGVAVAAVEARYEELNSK